MAALQTVAGGPLGLVGGGDLDLSEDPNKFASVNVTVTAGAWAFTRDPRPTFAFGLRPFGGDIYGFDERPLIRATVTATAIVAPTVTANGTINVTGTATSAPLGRTASANPQFPWPTAISAGNR